MLVHAFCPTTLPHAPRAPARVATRQIPICLARRKSRAKRPRTPPPPPPPDASPPTTSSPNAPDLSQTDSAGITLETRLREELEHPFRSPRQTLFTTLSMSATVGLLIAITRLLARADTTVPALQNIAIDLLAALSFAWLALREYRFGQRSLRAMSGRPLARDLAYVRASEKGILERILSRDVLVVVGDGKSVKTYLDGGVDGMNVVAFSMDQYDIGTGYVASPESRADWIAWLGPAVPPRKNVALFLIPALTAQWRGGVGADSDAKDYIVAIASPSELPRPSQARRVGEQTDGTNVDEQT